MDHEKTCSRCQKPSTKRCTGCSEAPVYDGHVSATFYCSRGCQKADWRQHRLECQKLQARKSLGRAALLLQAIFYRIRLYASPLRLSSMRVEGSTIYLEGSQLDVLDNERLLRPLPACLAGNKSQSEAVVVYMGCTEAMMYLYSFAKELLGGLCSKIEEVNASLINLKLRITPSFPNGLHLNTPDPFFHNLYRVTLPNGEIWAIDTTGAQCGYPDPLCPWRDFELHRSSSINRECEFGYIRHQLYQSHRRFPSRQMVAQTVEKQDLATALEDEIPTWALEFGGKLNGMLGGSDATFKQAKTRFLHRFEDYLKACMTKLYTAEQISRRNKVIDGQLSKNKTDPNEQKKVEGLTNFVVSTLRR